MSHRALKWAFDCIASVDMTPTAKVVLLALANRHNQETGRCDPGLGRIVDDTGICERSARTAIRQLEKLRLIATRQRRQRYGGQTKNLTNSYTLALKRGGANFAGGVGQKMPPNLEDTRAREVSRPYDLAALLDCDDD